MENLYYNLSEEEFSKGRKILLWIFVGIFFLAGILVLSQSIIFGHKSIHPILSTAPFGISLLVALIAIMASIKRKDLFFLVNDEKIEFRYGMFKAKLRSYKWADIKDLTMPQKQRKVMLNLRDGSSFIINLSWLQRKRSSIIKKHIYHAAKAKGMNIIRVATLIS